MKHNLKYNLQLSYLQPIFILISNIFLHYPPHTSFNTLLFWQLSPSFTIFITKCINCHINVHTYAVHISLKLPASATQAAHYMPQQQHKCDAEKFLTPLSPGQINLQLCSCLTSTVIFHKFSAPRWCCSCCCFLCLLQ